MKKFQGFQSADGTRTTKTAWLDGNPLSDRGAFEGVMFAVTVTSRGQLSASTHPIDTEYLADFDRPRLLRRVCDLAARTTAAVFQETSTGGEKLRLVPKSEKV